MSDGTTLPDRLADVRARIARAATRVGRDPSEITLVGVSKRMSADRVVEAARAGLRCLGENYVQEASAKQDALLGHPEVTPLRWHLIGPLQRNKAREAVRRFDVVESVDRIPLAEELERRAAEAGRTLDVLLQVNVSGEPQKSGVAPGELDALFGSARALPHLHVRGLMTVPEATNDPEAVRPAFATLRALRDRLQQASGVSLPDLSMGMSADFEIAIGEGATLVRVGTAIFGSREGA